MVRLKSGYDHRVVISEADLLLLEVVNSASYYELLGTQTVDLPCNPVPYDRLQPFKLATTTVQSVPAPHVAVSKAPSI